MTPLLWAPSTHPTRDDAIVRRRGAARRPACRSPHGRARLLPSRCVVRLGGSPGGSPSRCRRGFSFVEILFAIFVLGIGFIMIAAIFPVAITQTQVAAEESNGRTVAEGAKAQLEWAMKKFKPGDSNGEVMDLSKAPNLAFAMNTSRFSTADPRFGWVGLYKYDEPTNTATVWAIAVQVRNKSAFVPDQDWRGLSAVRVSVDLEDGSATGADRIVFKDSDGKARAAEGAYIIRARTQPGDPNQLPVPIRVGSAIDQANGVWELIQDPRVDVVDEMGVDVLIVGRGPDDYNQSLSASTNYVGGAQDAYIVGPYTFNP